MLSTDTSEGFLNQKLRIAFYIIICSGVCLAIYQFFFNRYLWYDEAMLATSIISRSYAELLQPLEMHQVTPIGFLMVSKFFSGIIPDPDMAYSLFPLMGFLGSIFLIYKLSDLLLNDFGSKTVSFRLFTTALFSITYQLIEMSSEVKPYSTDVFWGLAIAFLTLSYVRKQKNEIVLVTVGALSIWFSSAAVIMLFTYGSYMLFKQFRTNAILSRFIVCAWVLSFIAYYVLFIEDHPAQRYMQDIWVYQDAFFDWSDSLGGHITFFKRLATDLFGQILSFGPYWYLSFIIACVGILQLIKNKSYDILFLFLFPLFLHVILSGLKLYPVKERLILYTAPYFILLYANGIFSLYHRGKKLFNLKSLNINITLSNWLLIFPLLIMYYPFLLYYPIQKTEFNIGLKHVLEKRKEGEMILLSPEGKRVFDYYSMTNKYPVATVMDKSMVVTDIASLKGDFWYIMGMPNSKVSQEERDLYLGVYKDLGKMDCFSIMEKGYDDGGVFWYDGDCLE